MVLQPSPPTSHHQQPPLALASHQQPHNNNHKPYVIYSPVDKNNGPVCNMLNSWSNKAETTARNIWNNLRTGPSVTESTWGKLNLTAKAMSEGGFESLYKHLFGIEVNEKLKKTYSCSISTTTGPVTGTLYLSTHRLCFCSDIPLAFKAPSGPEIFSYYKVTSTTSYFSSSSSLGDRGKDTRNVDFEPI
ncbi:hypothetical protein LIER_37576 [Lithospermum erythrorhizon]|uniref:GRAM domain-containing protein n=1 Tax=Lithospermum erythrorhizon TaxID=34254 RepID=A0AAV3PPM1_LITER